MIEGGRGSDEDGQNCDDWSNERLCKESRGIFIGEKKRIWGVRELFKKWMHWCLKDLMQINPQYRQVSLL